MNFNPPLSRREALRTRKRRPSTITIPSCVSPPVALVFQEMRRQRITYAEVEEKSGVQRPTVKAWRHRNKPGLDSLEAVLGVLGWDLTPIPREKVLDPEVVAALKPIAERFEMSMPATIETLVALVARIHDRADAPSTVPTLEELALT